MAEIQRMEIVQGIVEGLRLNPAVDKSPQEVEDKVTAVYISNVVPPDKIKFPIIKTINTSSTGAATILTTPSDRDFYLCYANLTTQADATNDGINVSFNITPFGGAATTLLKIAKQTTTAIQESVCISFPQPIRIARNSTITVIHTFTVGASTTSGCVVGFEELI